MEVVYARCGGLDVHKRTVVACVVVPGPGPRPHKEVRTFGTMTDDLLRLADWLAEHQVTHVAMESTGVYWRPIWNILEGTVELLLANAQHVKATPRDCSHRQHGLSRCNGGGHGSDPSAVRLAPAAG